MPDAAVLPMDRRIEGVVAMTLDATENHHFALTEQRLFDWQAGLFPDGMSAHDRVPTGVWRDDARGPMQVVSGPIGRQRVHFEAPPAARIADEMQIFLAWFGRRDAAEGLLRAGLAHFWFVTIHPFEDGNGRIARAVADQALAQSEGINQRFYSLSGQIRRERSAYYNMLERSQRGTLDVTEWLLWFLACFGRAVDGADATSTQVLRKAAFWQVHAESGLSPRQKLVLNRVLDGFEGKLTAKKWAAIGKCSVPTAQRDLHDLVERGVLGRNLGGSKNTSYEVLASR